MITSLPGGATIFRISPSGDFSTLRVFPGRHTEHPSGPFLAIHNGDLFGTIGGKLFRLNRNGNFTTAISINGTNGILPVAGLIHGEDGLLFGVVACESDGGAILKVSNDGRFSTLADITSSTPSFRCPTGELIEARDGRFYGFAGSTLFSITRSGKLNRVFEFRGYSPSSALVEGNNGKIYGITHPAYPMDQGSIFCFTPDNSN